MGTVHREAALLFTLSHFCFGDFVFWVVLVLVGWFLCCLKKKLPLPYCKPRYYLEVKSAAD